MTLHLGTVSYIAVGLTSISLIAGCANIDQVARQDGSVVMRPSLEAAVPRNEQEIVEFCNELVVFESMRSRIHDRENLRSQCVNAKRQGIESRKEYCSRAQRDSSSKTRTNALEQCASWTTAFDGGMRKWHQYQDFIFAKTSDQYRSFIATYGASDSLRLVPEARFRLSKFCGDGVSLDGSVQAARDWLDHFGDVGPKHCVTQQAVAKRILRRDAFARAQGNEEALTQLLDQHQGEDPDGILDKARAQISVLHTEAERKSFAAVTDWASAERFIAKYDGDSHSVRLDDAKRLRDEKKATELAELAQIPLLDLRRQLALGRTNMPSAWTVELEKLIQARAPEEERSMLSTMDADGLRAFLKSHTVDAEHPESQSSREGLAAAEQYLHERLADRLSHGTDAQREAMLTDEFATSELKQRATDRLKRDYMARHEFPPILRLYKLTQDISLLQSGQGFVKSSNDRLALEQAAAAVTKSPGQFFDLDGHFERVSAEGNAKENMGLFANFTATVRQSLRGYLEVKPNKTSPLKLRYGTYQVTINLAWKAERLTTQRSTFLGNKDVQEPRSGSQMVTVRLSPPDYQGRVPFDFGSQEFGYFQSGSMGGFTAIQLLSDPVATAEVASITPVE
jgi:hypothetical protein